MNRNGQTIYDIVNTSCEHLTAEEVYFKAKKILPKIVMATVYNNLNRLVDEGKIRRIKSVGGADRYDNVMRHDHMQCVKCGSIKDVDVGDLTSLIREKTGDEIVDYDLTIRFVCEKCKNKEKTANAE